MRKTSNSWTSPFGENGMRSDERSLASDHGRLQTMLIQTAQKPKYVQHKGKTPRRLHQGIPSYRVQNVIWPLLLKMESTTKDEKEEGIATAAIDSEKYFDSICWEVTFQMLNRMGLDQRIWKPMLNFIAHLKRFNKVAGTLGTTWTCTNSITQGCSLSLLATAALSMVWARVLEEEYSPATALWTTEDSVRQEEKRRATAVSHPDHE